MLQQAEVVRITANLDDLPACDAANCCRRACHASSSRGDAQEFSFVRAPERPVGGDLVSFGHDLLDDGFAVEKVAGKGGVEKVF